jgi:hypothetical protein
MPAGIAVRRFLAARHAQTSVEQFADGLAGVLRPSEVTVLPRLHAPACLQISGKRTFAPLADGEKPQTVNVTPRGSGVRAGVARFRRRGRPA